MNNQSIDRSSKLSVISDVSRESDTYNELQQTRQQLISALDHMCIENQQLKRHGKYQEQRLNLAKQQLQLDTKPELHEYFELKNNVFQLNTKLSDMKISHLEEIKRIDQLHSKEKARLLTDFEQRLKLNKQAYNKELNEIKLMIKNKSDEKQIIQDQQEKLGRFIEEIRNSQLHCVELQKQNCDLKAELDRLNPSMSKSRKSIEDEEIVAMQERLSIKNGQIKLIQSELNFQKDLTQRLESDNAKLRESIQHQSRESIKNIQAIKHVDNKSSHQLDYKHLFEETKKLNNSLTEEVQRCYNLIRQLETEQEEKSRIRVSISKEESIKHKSVEEECFELRKELSENKIKLINATNEIRYLQASLETATRERQPLVRMASEAKSVFSQEGQPEVVVKVDHQITYLLGVLTQKQNEIAELTQNLIDKDETIGILQHKMVEIQMQNANLVTQQYNQINVIPPQASEEIVYLRSQNKRYQDQYRHLEQQVTRRIQSSNAKLLQAHQLVERLQIDLQEVNNWNHQLQQYSTTFKQQRDAVTIQRDELLIEINMFKENIQLLQSENEQFRHSKEQIQLDRNTFHMQKDQLQAELARLKSQIPRHIERKVSTSEKHVETLTQKVEQLKQYLKAAKTQKGQLQAKLNTAEQNQMLLEEKIELLKAVKDDAEIKRKAAESAANQIITKQNRQRASISQFQEQCRLLKAELVDRKNDYDRVTHEYESLKAKSFQQLKDMEGRMSSVKELLDAQKKEYEGKIKQMFDQQTAQYMKLNTSTLRLDSDLTRLREESQSHKGEVGLVNKQKAELFSRLSASRDELTNLLIELENKQKNIKASEQKLQQLEDYVKELELKCSMTSELNVQLQKQLDQLILIQNNTADSQKISALQNEVHSLRQIIDQLSKNHLSAQKEKTELIRELYGLRKSSQTNTMDTYNYRQSSLTNPQTNYLFYKPVIEDNSTMLSVGAHSPLQFEQMINRNSRLTPWKESQVPVRDNNSRSRSKVTDAEPIKVTFTRSAVDQNRPSPSLQT